MLLMCPNYDSECYSRVRNTSSIRLEVNFVTHGNVECRKMLRARHGLESGSSTLLCFCTYQNTPVNSRTANTVQHIPPFIIL